MKVIGVLCWAEENPRWLQAAVSALAPALDHLVALDGKYYLYPGALSQPASNIDQSLAITEACGASSLALTLYRPMEPYEGNEVEKRNKSLDLAFDVAESDEDWVVVFDADMIAFKAHRGLKNTLTETDAFVGEYARYESENDDGFTRVRGAYRLIEGLRYGPAHWTLSVPISNLGPTYRTDTDERAWLWGDPRCHQPYLDDCADLTNDLKFVHRNVLRDPARRDKAKAFYDRRDELGIESYHQMWTEGLDGKPIPVRRDKS